MSNIDHPQHYNQGEMETQPGPLYGVSSHAWSALALAITAHHQITNMEVA